MASQPPPTPKPRKKRRTVTIMLIVSILALTTCCGGGAVYAFKRFHAAQQRTPEGAVTEYFSAIQFKDTDRLKNSLCSEKRKNAQSYISEFYSRLDTAGFTLRTMSWIPTGPSVKSGENRIFNGKANLTVLRQEQTFDLSIGYRVTVTHHLFTWYACGAEVTS